MNSKFNLDILPPEVVTQFLLRLSLKDLINYCQTSKAANEYCENGFFWKDKYRYDFGLPLPVLKEGGKWIDIYKERVMNKNSPISVGLEHYAVIDNQGILYMAGKNMYGQLGDGTKNDSKTPVMIKFFTEKVISVSCGNNFTMAITADGKTYGWGRNSMFPGEQMNILTPVLMPTPTTLKATKVSCGGNKWGVILDDGSVYVSIELFYGGKIMETINRVSLEDKIIDISVYTSHFSVVTESGKLYFAGKSFSQVELIGIEISRGWMKGTIKPKYIPFPPKQGIIPKIKQVSISKDRIMALTVDGDVFIWGINQFSEVSSDRRRIHLSPQLLTSFPKISYISSSEVFSSAITTDGRLYIWGSSRILRTMSNIKEGDKRILNFPKFHLVLVPVEIDIGSRVNYIAHSYRITIANTVDGMVNYIGNPN